MFNNIITEINSLLSKDDFDKYWPGFYKTPYALYDKEHICLVNYPKLIDGFSKDNELLIGPWDARFMGNTCIILDDIRIAILDLNCFSNPHLHELYSVLVHEMFHVYQQEFGDNHNYNLALQYSYPFTNENLELRILEREYLIKSLFAESNDIFLKNIEIFINIREQRHSLIGEIIDYENNLECQEGTAYYIQVKNLANSSKLPEKFLISKFGLDLYDYSDMINKFRQGCYSSGLYLCYLLDKVYPKWKSKYMTSSSTLYEILKSYISYKNEPIVLQNYNKSNTLIAQYASIQNSTLANFLNSEGFKITLKGNLSISALDPMNITQLSSSSLLHTHVIKFKANDTEYYIQGNTLQKFDDTIFKTTEISFFTENKPEVKNNFMHICNIGDFFGEIIINGDNYICTL